MGTSGGPAVGQLTAGEVHRYLRSLDGGWVKSGTTVDTFKAGSPDAVVSGIAVGWMSSTRALERALALGCSLFVTHEPTFYSHRDDDPSVFRLPAAADKRKLIEEGGLTIIRCHDVWDQFPGIGIPSGWGRFLELGEPLEGSGYFFVYDGGGRTAGDLARKIAARTETLGQPGVLFFGPADKPVHRLALGTGAITPLFHFIDDLKADMAICTDDGFVNWRDGAYAVDAGFPVAVVNHPVSEEFAMKLLADHLRGRFPQVPVHHIPGQCLYSLVRST